MLQSFFTEKQSTLEGASVATGTSPWLTLAEASKLKGILKTTIDYCFTRKNNKNDSNGNESVKKQDDSGMNSSSKSTQVLPTTNDHVTIQSNVTSMASAGNIQKRKRRKSLRIHI